MRSGVDGRAMQHFPASEAGNCSGTLKYVEG
jgi:hypothetical protein